MRHISCAITTAQILDQSKDVTRRLDGLSHCIKKAIDAAIEKEQS